MGSRIIEAVIYCNQILLAQLYINRPQNTSVNWILRLLLLLLCRPKVILLSGGHCKVFTIARRLRKFHKHTENLLNLSSDLSFQFQPIVNHWYFYHIRKKWDTSKGSSNFPPNTNLRQTLPNNFIGTKLMEGQGVKTTKG